LSWLVSFWAHVKIASRIVSYVPFYSEPNAALASEPDLGLQVALMKTKDWSVAHNWNETVVFRLGLLPIQRRAFERDAFERESFQREALQR